MPKNYKYPGPEEVQKATEMLLDPLGKNIEAHLSGKHNSVVESLVNKGIEKDILLSRCKNFDKLPVSPIYNTKFVQDYISATEGSMYTKNLRHYIPLLALKARDKVFKPALEIVTDYVKTHLMDLASRGLKQETVRVPLMSAFQPVIQDVYDYFQILHPDLWDGNIINNDIFSKSVEIATNIAYYSTLDDEILKNFEDRTKKNGEEYAYTVTSFLRKGKFAEIKKRGYFLESELDMLLDSLPSLLCPNECPEGFFNEMLDSCNTKQREIIRKMFEDLSLVQVKDLPKNAIPFDKLLLYILSKTQLD